MSLKNEFLSVFAALKKEEKIFCAHLQTVYRPIKSKKKFFNFSFGVFTAMENQNGKFGISVLRALTA